MSIFKLLFPDKFDELGRLTNLNADLLNELESYKKSNSRLREETKKQSETFYLSIEQKDKMITKIKAACDVANREWDKVKLENSEIREQIKERQSQVNNAANLLKDLNKKLEDKSKAYSNLAELHNTLGKDVAVFKEEFIKLEAELNSYKKQAEDLKQIREKQLQQKRDWHIKKKSNAKK